MEEESRPGRLHSSRTTVCAGDWQGQLVSKCLSHKREDQTPQNPHEEAGMSQVVVAPMNPGTKETETGSHLRLGQLILSSRQVLLQWEILSLEAEWTVPEEHYVKLISGTHPYTHLYSIHTNTQRKREKRHPRLRIVSKG